MSWDVAPVLGCPDVAASAAWWRAMLDFDFDPVRHMAVDADGLAIYATLERAGAGVHLQRRSPMEAARPHIAYDAYFYVDTDIDDLFERYVAKGVVAIFAPTNEMYGLRDFGIETPDGHRLNFGSPLPPPAK